MPGVSISDRSRASKTTRLVIIHDSLQSGCWILDVSQIFIADDKVLSNRAHKFCSCDLVAVGTYTSTNETLQWRLPLALACVGPMGLLISIFYVPGKLFRKKGEI